MSELKCEKCGKEITDEISIEEIKVLLSFQNTFYEGNAHEECNWRKHLCYDCLRQLIKLLKDFWGETNCTYDYTVKPPRLCRIDNEQEMNRFYENIRRICDGKQTQ